MSETPIEQTKRHIQEGAERIAKQRKLTEKLKEHGPSAMLTQAEQLLEQMEDFQKIGHEHLATEQTLADPN